jgi:hypothetical protein
VRRILRRAKSKSSFFPKNLRGIRILSPQLDPVTENSRGDGLTAKAEAKRLGFFRFYARRWPPIFWRVVT